MPKPKVPEILPKLPSMGDKREPIREESDEDDAEGGDDCFHSPREVGDVPPGEVASSSSDTPPPPIASPEVTEEMKAREELKKQKRRDSRRLAQSKYHLLDHYGP